MTNFRKLTSSAAIVGVTALMSTSAFAMEDMSCGDFMAMNPDDQMHTAMMMQGPDAGRAEAREEATGGDSTMSEGAAAESSSSSDTEMNDDSGQEGQHDKARGEDMVAAMTEYCKGGDDLMLGDMRHPSDSTESKSE